MKASQSIIIIYNFMVKLYQAWPARNRFLPWGCVCGPARDSCANLYVYSMFVAVLIPYCIFILPGVWKINLAIPILFLLAVISTIIFLLLAQCSDPGIIPRRSFLESEPQKFNKYLYQTISTQVVAIGRNFCQTCKIYRPKRASHCSTCDTCIEVFDHHCPFVNNCIGKRNYRFFVLFLVGMMLSIGTCSTNLIFFALWKAGSTVNSTVIIVICSVAFGIVGVPLLSFLIFHIYLCLTGKTTRQLIKNINEEEEQQNQWCHVDPPLVNYFADVSEQQIQLIKNSLEKLDEFKAQNQPTNTTRNQFRSNQTRYQASTFNNF